MRWMVACNPGMLANRSPYPITVVVYGPRTLLGSTPATNRTNTQSLLARFLPTPLLTTWTNTLGIQDPLIRHDPHVTVEYVIVRKLPATPVNLLLLVASLCKNGQRDTSRRLIRSLEPTIGKDNLTLLPSSIRLQFVRKLQTLRYSDDVRILVSPNFPVTSDTASLAALHPALI